MQIQYGKTWWGQAYLGALSQIDFENRLARGKSYARNERITDLHIHEHIVEAKIKGSRPQPYRVSITHMPLLQSAKKELTNILAKRPDLTSEILNLRLPEEILDICIELDIRLFPNSWRDIKLNCNCPDWAVPCKHIAAVIYTISNEIDKDPFLVFKLLKFDLLEALHKKGLTIAGDTLESFIPAIQSFVSPVQLKRGSPLFNASLYDSIDLSTIPALGTSIPQFLEPKPVFYPNGDFSALLISQYDRMAKYVSSDMAFPDGNLKGIDLAFLRKIDYLEIVLLPDLSLDAFWLEGADNSLSRAITDMDGVFKLMAMLRPEDMIMLASEFKLISLAWEIAIEIVRKGAVIPVIYSLHDHSFRILWQPASHLEAVSSILEVFGSILRHDMISYQGHDGHLHYVKANLQPNVLISLFISHLVTSCNSGHSKLPQDTLNRFFFKGSHEKFSSFSERKTVPSIRQWLDAVMLVDAGYQPRIWIHEKRNGGFEMSIEMDAGKGDASAWIPLSEFMDSASFQKARPGVLKSLSQLGGKFPAIREAIRHFGKKKIPLKEEEVIGILGQVEGIMQMTRTKILLPKSLQNILRPKRSLHVSAKDSQLRSGLLGLNQLLAFQWQIALGDHIVSPEEFQKMIEGAGRLLKIKDQYVILDRDEILSMLHSIEKGKSPSASEMFRFAVAEEYEGSSIHITEEVRKWLTQLRTEPKVKLPLKLNAVLRPYQVRGFSWLWKNAQLGFGSILADDMGLGKTLQVLSFLQKAKQEGWLKQGPAMIVAPATLLTNWEKECNRFTPDLIPFIYHGTKRKLPEGEFDLLITTYGLVRADQKKLGRFPWSVIVIDEAQNIKTISASQTKAVMDMQAKIRIAMSGTPVENRLAEYYSISQFANPGYLGTQASFRREFANPIESHRDHERLDLFKRMTSPFLMRRLKTDKTVINDLPDKIVINRYSALTPDQVSLYEACTQQAMNAIRGAEDAISRRGLVLKMLLNLKQICNHPYNFTKHGRKEASRTGKSEALREIIDQIREEGRKALIFTQYREMGEILLDMLREWGEDALFLHGGLNRKERDRIVTSFQQHHWPSVLVLSIKAGGTGLNLTAATHVIHYDLWWNPAVESQATDRAFRIGQKHNVTVHRIITRNTLEENIDQLMQRKKDLAELTVSTGEKWIGELSDREIEALVSSHQSKSS